MCVVLPAACGWYGVDLCSRSQPSGYLCVFLGTREEGSVQYDIVFGLLLDRAGFLEHK